MKRKKYTDWLWIISLAIFLVCTLEGVFWYSTIKPVSDDVFVQALLFLQNGIKAFKLDPDIKLKDVAEALPGIESTAMVLFTYLYCLAVIAAPFCTVAALAVLVRKPLYYLKGLKNRVRHRRILLIGSGDAKEHFAEALPGDDCRVYTIEKGPIPEEKQLRYLQKGIRCFVSYEDRTEEKLYRRAELEDSDLVLLCDDDPVRNLLNLKNINGYYEQVKHADKSLGRTGSRQEDTDGSERQSESTRALRPRQEIYVTCEDEGMKEVMSLFYDEQLRKNAVAEKTPGASPADGKFYDLSIVDVKERAVRKMLAENPVYTANGGRKTEDAHIGILGFGSFGQQVLMQSLNLAVFSKDSTITVDVFDRSIDVRFSAFLRRFSTKMLDRVEKNVNYRGGTVSYQIRLGRDAQAELEAAGIKDRSFDIDGNLILRFWGTDTETLDYRRKIELCSADEPFTYFVIALKEDCETTVSMLDVCRAVYGSGAEAENGVRVPIILRTKDGGAASQLFSDGRVSTIEQKKDIYSLKVLTDDSLMQKAKQFNYRYNRVASGQPDTMPSDRSEPDASWHKMTSFKRESSIAQAMHQQVKVWLVENGLKDKEEQEAVEHRRWCIFMILHGYAYGQKRNDILKYHDCLSAWENLKRERPDTLEYDYTPYLLIK